MLRNCKEHHQKHLIAIVETYFKLSRQMNTEAYINLLKNCVYSNAKAIEIS